MDTITNPQTYQTSQIVEKSSKTGIFSNKRLLVIKNGFLYYFTNVPKNYKTHVPNVLNTLKQLPKSSIEIRVMQQIKMQSSNSTNLIIKFSEKDMIEREDIRKSITDKNYSHTTKKATNQLEQWKFTYATVLKCRLWYTALLKLKSHFAKQQDKIAQFFSNFDPAKRNSQLPPQIKHIFRKQDDPNNKTAPKQQLNIIQQFKKQDLKKKQPSIPPLPPVSPKSNQQSSPISKIPSLGTIKQQQQPPVTLKQQQSTKNLKQATKTPINRLKEYQQSARQEAKQDKSSSPIKLPVSNVSKQQSSPVHRQILKEKQRQQIAEKIREQEKKKADMIIMHMKQEMEKKQSQLKDLQFILKNKEKDLEVKEKTMVKDGEKFLKYSEDYEEQIFNIDNRHHTNRTVQLNQFSVQTDQEDSFIQPYNNNNQSINKKKYESFLQDFNSTQRDTYNFYRNTDSLSFQLQETDKKYDNYDYYTEIGRLYNQNNNNKDDKTQNKVKFQQQIKKQIKLLNYIEKMKDIAQETIKEYIDENIGSNKINSKLVSFQSTLFHVKLACCPGKIINISTSKNKEKLVYSNKQHQSLKRQFKIYNALQDRILRMLTKRPNYPIRVPLAFYIEYRGYSALLRYMPYTENLLSQSTESITYGSGGHRGKVMKMAHKIILQNDHLQDFDYLRIVNRDIPLYLLDVVNSYKITRTQQEQQNIKKIYSNALRSQNVFSAMQMIKQCRKRHESTNIKYLENQLGIMVKEVERLSMKQRSGKVTSIINNLHKQLTYKIMSLKQVILCRNLKNLYRSTQPYTQLLQPQGQKPSKSQKNKPKFSTFLQGFLSSPEQIKQLVSCQDLPSYQGQIIVNGLLLSYFEQLFGFYIPEQDKQDLIDLYQEFKQFRTHENYNQQQQQIYEKQLQAIKIQVYPVVRCFTLAALNSNKLLDNLENYIQAEKYNLVDSAIEIMYQLEHRNPDKDVGLHLLIISYKLRGISNISINMGKGLMTSMTKSKEKNSSDIQIVSRCRFELQQILAPERSITIMQKLQCQFLLMQCYSILGQYEQSIQLIFQSLNYLEFAVGSTGGLTQDYLYLLAAETLAKMNKQQESVTIYNKLLTSSPTCTLSQQEIYISLIGVIDNLMAGGPKDVIEILLPLAAHDNLDSTEMHNKFSKVHNCYVTKHHSIIYNILGNQYLLLNNVDQALRYLKYSLAYYIQIVQEGEKSIYNMDANNFCDTCLQLLRLYHKNSKVNQKNTSQVFDIFAQVSMLAGTKLGNKQISYFYTNAVCCIADYILKQANSDNSKNNLMQVLEQMRDVENQAKKTETQSIENIKYEHLYNAIQKFSGKLQNLSEKQLDAINMVDISQLQTYMIARG